MHKLTLLGLCSIFPSLLLATPIIANSDWDNYALAPAKYFMDVSGELSIHEVSNLEEGFFKAYQIEDHQLELNDKVYWIQYELTNESNFDAAWIFDFYTWAYVDFFYQSEYQGEIVHLKSGALLPFREKDLPFFNKSLVELPIKSKDKVMCWVRLERSPKQNMFPQNLSIEVSAKAKKSLREGLSLSLQYFFLAIFLVMILYNLFIYHSTRESFFPYYISMLVLLCIELFIKTGIMVWLLGSFDFYPMVEIYISPVIIYLLAYCLGMFAIHLFKLSTEFPKWHLALRIFLLIYLIPLGLCYFSYQDGFELLGALGGIYVILILALGIRLLRSGVPSSGYFFVGYLIYLSGALAAMFDALHLVPHNIFTGILAMPLGASFEMILFCYAQLNRIKSLRIENEVKQAELTLSIAEKEKSDKLLLNVFPRSTAEELKKNGSVEPINYENVTVLLSDFVNFTQIANSISSAQLVEELDYCFKSFDDIISNYKLEKIKTIGDAYMCVGGIPTPQYNDAERVIMAAMDIVFFMEERGRYKIKRGEIPWGVRIGVHSGPVTAGIVGKKKFTYDIWGDTVNLTSRMETASMQSKINISAKTYSIVNDMFRCTYRGKIPVKHRGEMEMYFVDGYLQNKMEWAF